MKSPCLTRPTAAVHLILLGLGVSSLGQTVTFNFDSGLPALSPDQSLPLSQTVEGVTALFSANAGPAFSVQNARSTGDQLSWFAGHYLGPSKADAKALSIRFNSPLAGIAFTFATVEERGSSEVSGNLQVTGYMDSTNSAPVGSVTVHGTDLSDTYPQGVGSLWTGPGRPFNLVEITVTLPSTGTRSFLLDDVSVTLNTPPQLGAVLREKSVVIFWSAPSSGINDGYGLQESPDLSAAHWVNATNQLALIVYPGAPHSGGQFQGTFVPGAAHRFYRLVHP